jgi:4-hydroxy-2-oxoglutarate aldolase
VPVVLYNYTALTGVNLPVSAVVTLAGHPNIVGIKESSGDVGQIAEFVAETPADFVVLAGSGPHFYAALAVGASGGILALATVVPELCVQLFALVREGRHREALALQRRLVPLARAITTRYGVPGLKLALTLAGYAGGEPRAPLRPPPPEARAVLGRMLADLGVLAAA